LWCTRLDAQIASPTFRCTNKKANSVRLHYTPGKESRVGLAPFVNGTRTPGSHLGALLAM
jgi:hypothetical protein